MLANGAAASTPALVNAYLAAYAAFVCALVVVAGASRLGWGALVGCVVLIVGFPPSPLFVLKLAIVGQSGAGW